MTNHTDINLFLNSISEAKRALDAEPGHLQRIRELEKECEMRGDTIAKRELHIHSLKQEHETLQQKLRSVEAERDDAGFRALEETDKVQAMLTLMRGFVGDATRCVAHVEGVEPPVTMKAEDIRAQDAQAVEQNRRIHDLEMQLSTKEMELQGLQASMAHAQEQLARPQPELVPAPTQPGPIEDHTKPAPFESAIPSEGVSVHSDPTVSQEPIQSLPASSTSAQAVEDAASQGSKERNRDPATQYTGRKYYDVPVFVPLHEWIAKGGTEENYYWRPNANIA